MSDFDKEAERQKLREKLERDEEAREATEHMSELLLKGATMTNKHCDDCGDPVFRYEGQEFCPTCGQTVAEEAQTGESEQATEPAGADADAGSAAAGTPVEDQHDAGGSAAAAQQTGAAVGANRQAGSGSAQRGARSVGAPAQGGAPSGDLGEARAALVRKLTALAQQAEATDDVSRSRELLAAAREAAEALAAVDRVQF